LNRKWKQDKGEPNLNEEAFPVEKERLARWPAIVLASAMVFLYALGIYSIIRFFVLHLEALAFIGLALGVFGEIISRNIETLTYLLIGLVAVTIISIPLILKAMAKFGRTVMVFAIFAPAILIIGIGVLFVILGLFIGTPIPSLFGLLFLLFGGVMLFFLHRWRGRVYLAGHIFELSAKAVATEIGTLVPSILFGLFSVFNVIMGAASVFFVLELLAPVQNSIVTGIVIFLVELGYAWLVFSFMYLADGTIIGIIDDWYRNPTVDKANLMKGFVRVWRVVGPIIKFSFVMALLSTVARTVRKKAEEQRTRGEGGLGLIGLMFLGLVTAIAYGLVQFITYFTLPAMVIEGKGFKDSVQRSYTLMWRHWVDVLLAYFGIESAYALFMVAMLALYGTAGAAVGWFLIAPALVTTVPPIFVSIFTVVAFILVGFIPAYFLFRPMKAAYNTILYEFAKDMEAGGQLPSRMPPDLKQQFQNIIAREQATPRIGRWAEPKFPEELVTKIKEEFKEAKEEGLVKYVKERLIGEETKTEVGLMKELCEHLRRIGVDSTLLESGSIDTIERQCIKVEGRNIDFVQVQSLPSTSGRPSELCYQYHYVVRVNVKGLESKLKAEVKPPAYWKLDLIEKRVVDFKWEGGELAQMLNADFDLKNKMLKGGLDKLVMSADKEHQCVRIMHTPGTWTTITVGSVSLAVGRKAFPTREDFEAYDKIAQHIRSIANVRP